MRRTPLYTILAAAALLAAILVTPAHAMSNGAPQLNCVMCHQDAAKHPADFVIEGLPKTVEPGKEYKITIKITKAPESQGASYGGFAMYVEGGEPIVVDSKNTQIATVPSPTGGTIKVLTHTKEGSMKKEWTVGFKVEKCPAKIAIAVIAANGDGTQNGDWFAEKTLTLQCAGPTTTTTVVTETVTTTTVVTSTTYTTSTITESNPMLAVGVAVAIFVIVVAGYTLATRK